MSLSQHRQREQIEESRNSKNKTNHEKLLEEVYSSVLNELKVNNFGSNFAKYILPASAFLLYNLYKILRPYASIILKGITASDWITISLLLLFFTYILISNYLGTDKESIERINRNIENLRFIDNSRSTESSNYFSKDELSKSLEEIKGLINRKEPAINLDEERKQEVYQLIISSISSNLTKDFFDSIRDTVKSQIIEDKKEQLNLLNKRGESSIFRLKNEIEQLSKRANTNLAIGSTVTIAALAALSYFILKEDFDSIAD